MKIGEKIKIERKRLGFTLQKLADLTESSKSYIWEIESGKNKEIGHSKLLKIARSLGVTTDFLADDRRYCELPCDEDRVLYSRIQDFNTEEKHYLKCYVSAIESARNNHAQ